MKNIGVLGCTGSIGRSTLSVCRADGEFCVSFLANKRSLEALKADIAEFRPKIAVCVEARYLYADGKEYDLPEGFLTDPDNYACCDVVVNGISGLAGLPPSLAILRAGKVLATANKESFVCAGTLVNALKKETNGVIYPLDSEHSAVWQLLSGKSDAERIILTASGGAFRDLPYEKLKEAKAADALRHPTWIMGKKVTIDCATLMNKGMEIIEAKHLFALPVEILGHRESLIHALVEYSDGTFAANISATDMSVPISYALHYPRRADKPVKKLSLLSDLHFFKPDPERFPCLKIAKEAALSGDIAGCVMNSADEVLVEKYLAGEIGFYDISDGIRAAMDKFALSGDFDDCEAVFRMDKAVREYTLSMFCGGKR